MYSIKDDQRTHRRRKSSGIVNVGKTKPHGASTQLGGFGRKEDQKNIDDSSSLTGLSDDEDNSAGELGGLSPGPHKAAATSKQESSVSWDADDTLLDSLSREILALAPKPEKDLIDLGDMDVSDTKPSITAGFMNPHPFDPSDICNMDCRREIGYLRTRIEKLEDLVYASYRVPPPEVASSLEEYKRL
ncbi:hypothetical protein DFH28DRAFT_914936 [Melampsora americana]|nr:hypothetical protein DFH28DRAFT_914936 [Melampsora americana]